MARTNYSYEKRQRELLKKKKKEAKQQRKEQRQQDGNDKSPEFPESSTNRE